VPLDLAETPVRRRAIEDLRKLSAGHGDLVREVVGQRGLTAPAKTPTPDLLALLAEVRRRLPGPPAATRWTEGQAADFGRRLEVLQLDYSIACDAIESTGAPRPGAMGDSPEADARRARALRWLDSDEGRSRYVEIEAQRTEALDFARSLSVSDRKVASEKAGLPTSQPAKLSLLQLLSLCESAPVDDEPATAGEE